MASCNNRQSPNLSESGSDSDCEVPKTTENLELNSNLPKDPVSIKFKRKISAPSRSKCSFKRLKTKYQPSLTSWSSALDSLDQCLQNTGEASESGAAFIETDSDEDIAWEDVDSVEQSKSTNTSSTALQVYVDLKGTSKSLKSKNILSVEDAFDRTIKRARQKQQIIIHRVHLLCLLANLLNRSQLCDNLLVQAVCLSFIPNEFLRKGLDRWLVADLACFLAWFRRQYKSLSKAQSDNCVLVKNLAECAHFNISFGENMVLLFVSTIRAMGGHARLVSLFQVLPCKLDTVKILKSTKKRPATGLVNRCKKVDSNRHKLIKCKPPLVDDLDFKFWAEVLLPEEGDRWIPVDCLCSDDNAAAVDDANAIGSRCKPPLIIVSSEAGGLIADVSARYDPLWGTETRRNFDFNWWHEILNADWISRRNAMDIVVRAETTDFRARQRAFPLPNKCEKLRGHPLYAMPLHLHKYEVIYPSDSIPLAHLKGEPIYSRELVHVCHTRETWFRQARVVMPNAVPVKRVKARSQKQNMSAKDEDLQTVDVFGYWQTKSYEPSSLSQDGKVPRNEYGNVDLYQPSMLPHGCTHLKLSGIGRIARELGVDAAVAITGWEFNARSHAHPVQEGWVVPTASVSYLTDAWVQKENLKTQRRKNQIMERVVARWERLVRGMFIKARLKNKYGTS